MKTSVKDICKDGGIFKKILVEWEKLENPKNLDEVFVKNEACLEYGTLISKSHRVEFTVGNGYFCLALAKAVITMKKREKVLLTVAAVGNGGVIPPNATLHNTLELIS
ncbi:hypothetical protein REPUB_Repub20aG0050000 [Reevesia pubescens]